MEYAKPRNAIARHVDDEDKKGAPIQGNLGGKQEMTVIDNEPYFSLNDVCRILDIKNPRDVKKRLNKDGVVTIDGVDSIGRKADVTM